MAEYMMGIPMKLYCIWQEDVDYCIEHQAESSGFHDRLFCIAK